MTKTKRPIHRGITDFGLWGLATSKAPATLAGRRVVVLKVQADGAMPSGFYNVQVQDTETSEVFWMDATTDEYEQRRRDRKKTQARHRDERRNWGL